MITTLRLTSASVIYGRLVIVVPSSMEHQVRDRKDEVPRGWKSKIMRVEDLDITEHLMEEACEIIVLIPFSIPHLSSSNIKKGGAELTYCTCSQKLKQY